MINQAESPKTMLRQTNPYPAIRKKQLEPLRSVLLPWVALPTD